MNSETTSNHHVFFDQFCSNRDTRPLSPIHRQRFFDARPVLCFECRTLLPVYSTSDDYLYCAGCGVSWDLLLARPVITKTERLPQIVLPL